MAKCKTAVWRGNTVCAHWVPYLDEFAKATGAFVVTPIPGYGSYENNPTSAGTDEGGGHCDFYMTRIPSGMTRRQIETLARKILGMAYDRVRLVKNGTVYWTDHLHVEDPRCPNLSSAAAAQFPRYFDGRNNLASNGLDTGTRAYVDRHKSLFVNRKTNAASGKYPPIVISKPEVPPVTTQPPKPPTTLPTPPTPGSPEYKMWYWDGLYEPNRKVGSTNPFWTPASYLSEMYKQNATILANQKKILDALARLEAK